MNKTVILIIVAIVAVLAIAFVATTQKPKSENNNAASESVAAQPTQTADKETDPTSNEGGASGDSNALFDLKNALTDTVQDSVAEEVQDAVVEEVAKEQKGN